MFQLQIDSLGDLWQTIPSFRPTHIVSVIDGTMDPLPGEHQHLHVAMSDVAMPCTGFIHPTAQHLEEILQFTQNLGDDDRLLVHCFAGQSRSTAVAIGILIQHSLDYREAFDTVARLRPILLPNRLLILLIDDHFNLGGQLEHLVYEYYRGSVDRPDGSDETAVNWMRRLIQSLDTGF